MLTEPTAPAAPRPLRSSARWRRLAALIVLTITAGCHDDVDRVAPPSAGSAVDVEVSPAPVTAPPAVVDPADAATTTVGPSTSTAVATVAPAATTTAATTPPPAVCLDEAAAKSLAEPYFPGVEVVTLDLCSGAIAAGSGFFPGGDGFTVAFVNDGSWRYLAGSYGIRSVCEALWAYDVTLDIGCGTNRRWPYEDYFSVPQLSTEKVRGSGCGGSGEIGDVIPDGVWNGYLVDIGTDSLAFDLACVYFDASAQPFIDEYLRTTPEDQRVDYNPSYWLVNNSERARQVPLAAGFIHRWAEWTNEGCQDPGPSGDLADAGPDGMDAWLTIENGAALFLLTSCSYG